MEVLKKNINQLKNKSLEEWITVFFGIYILTLLLDYTSIVYANDVFVLILKGIRYICYGMFIVKIVSDFKKGEKITNTIIVLFIISLIIAIVAKNKSILLLLLVLIALRKMDFNKLVEMTFKIFFITFFIVLSLSLLGILPDWTFNRGTTIRHSLGFVYATDAIGIYLTIILMYFYIKRDKAKTYELFVLEVINVFLYNYTDGRTSFILISIILFMLFIIKFKFIKNIFNSKYMQKTIKGICYTLPLIFFISFHLLICLYGANNSLAITANELLSNRLQYTYQAYDEHGVTMFGKDIQWKGWGGYGYKNIDKIQEFKYNYVDSSYAKIVFDYGLVFSTIIIFAYTALLVKNYNNKNYWLMISIIFVLIWSFLEQYLLSIGKNIFVLAFIPFLELGQIDALSYKNLIKGRSKENEKVNNEELHI